MNRRWSGRTGRGETMEITLHERTEDTVRIYFEKAQQPFIRSMLPQRAKTVEEALAAYRHTRHPGANSFGRTIRADGRYVGDVWVYCIDLTDTPNAMLSYCVFEPEVSGRGIATQAVSLFLEAAAAECGLRTVGAFTYADNAASIRVLEKNGFEMQESFTEEDRLSYYFQKNL